MCGYYTEAKAKIIKESIKNTRFKDRKKVDDLMKIESLAAAGYFRGVSRAAPKFRELCRKYPDEWASIWKEIIPEDFMKMEKDRISGEWKKEDAMLRKTKKEVIEGLRKDWKKMGGKD